MTPPQCFGVVVRSIGLLLLLASLHYLLTGVWLWLAGSALFAASVSSFFLYGLIGYFISLYLLRGAPLLVRFCYPPANSTA